MGGLNPNALQYAPLKQQIVKKESSYKQKHMERLNVQKDYVSISARRLI